MNWVDFLDEYQIPYTTSGPNTSKGWVSIKCPYCGDDDPSMHMGINLEGGQWSCWRSASHRGKKPYNLVSRLLNCNFNAADNIVSTYDHADPDNFILSLGNPSLRAAYRTTNIKAVAIPPDFMEVKPFSVTHKFWEYLENRDFIPANIVPYYKIMASLTGPFKGRLILPIFTPLGCMGWQARAINKAARKSRYLTSSPQVKQVLFNGDKAAFGDTLYVCEGPFDALKIDAYGQHLGIRAVSTMGATPSPMQITAISRLSKNFKRTIIVFDNDGAGLTGTFQLQEWLPGVEILIISDGKDVGEMSSGVVRQFLSSN